MYHKIINYLDNCIKNDFLSHAYIFYGPDETAKKTIALKFANKILNTNQAGQTWHPDLILISADADEERSVNFIRQLKKFLTLSSYSGKYKIAIIEEAHNLNAYAQNALLKIFEEAPRHAIIILFAKTIDSIPETLASRGTRLPFWRQNNTDLPIQIEGKIIEILDKILNNEPKNRYLTISSIKNHKTIEIFEAWLKFLRAKFLFDPNKKLTDLLKISQNVFFKLKETNLNPKLAYDELIINLWKF